MSSLFILIRGDKSTSGTPVPSQRTWAGRVRPGLYFRFFMKNSFTKFYDVLVSVLVEVKEVVSKNISVELGKLKVDGPALFVLPVVVLYFWFWLEMMMVMLSGDLPAEVILNLAETFK